jgi:hypothetical protein
MFCAAAPTHHRCHPLTIATVITNSELIHLSKGLVPLLSIRRVESTVRYLGIEVDDALAVAEQVAV